MIQRAPVGGIDILCVLEPRYVGTLHPNQLAVPFAVNSL